MTKYLFIVGLSLLFTIIGCNSKKMIGTSIENNPNTKNQALTKNPVQNKNNDTIKISNPALEYEVIIIDSGFSNWLDTRSFPRGYLAQSYMENKNNFYIQEWNNRVNQPQRYRPNLYEMSIDYNPSLNYGYEVNYLIYNYMIYFQNTYKQNLYGSVPSR